MIPHAKRDLLKREGEVCKIYLTAPAVDGKANRDLILFLAEHFQVKKEQIEIIKGLKSRKKTINIHPI